MPNDVTGREFCAAITETVPATALRMARARFQEDESGLVPETVWSAFAAFRQAVVVLLRRDPGDFHAAWEADAQTVTFLVADTHSGGTGLARQWGDLLANPDGRHELGRYLGEPADCPRAALLSPLPATRPDCPNGGPPAGPPPCPEVVRAGRRTGAGRLPGPVRKRGRPMLDCDFLKEVGDRWQDALKTYLADPFADPDVTYRAVLAAGGLFGPRVRRDLGQRPGPAPATRRAAGLPLHSSST